MTELTPKEKRDKIQWKLDELKHNLNDLHGCLEHTTETLGSFFSMAFDLEYEMFGKTIDFEKDNPEKTKKKQAKKGKKSLTINEEANEIIENVV